MQKGKFLALKCLHYFTEKVMIKVFILKTLEMLQKIGPRECKKRKKMKMKTEIKEVKSKHTIE